MPYDLNEAKDETLVPPGIYRLKVEVVQTDKVAKNLRTQMLVVNCRVIGGEHAGSSFREWITTYVDLRDNGVTPPLTEEQAGKYKKAVGFGLAKLRRILESANEIDHGDESDEAKAKRKFATLDVFHGLEFWGLVGVKEAGDGFDARNVLRRA